MLLFSQLMLSFQLYYPAFVEHQIKEKKVKQEKSIYAEEKPQHQIWPKYFQEQNQVMPNSRGWMEGWCQAAMASTRSRVQLHIGEKLLCFFAYWTKCPVKQHLNKCWKFSSTQMQAWNQLMAKLQLEGTKNNPTTKNAVCNCGYSLIASIYMHAFSHLDCFPHPFWRPALNFSLTHMQEENKLLCSLS